MLAFFQLNSSDHVLCLDLLCKWQYLFQLFSFSFLIMHFLNPMLFHFQVLLHPEQDRVLSIRENARLQGFPDCYKLCGPVKQRYVFELVSYLELINERYKKNIVVRKLL